MLERVFKIDVLKCECGGKFGVVAAVMDVDSIRRYLQHIGEDYEPPPRAPPRYQSVPFDFDQTYET